MNKMEQAALDHAKEQLRYQNSYQSVLDAKENKIRREIADRKAGHLPTCSLTKCDPKCNRK